MEGVSTFRTAFCGESSCGRARQPTLAIAATNRLLNAHTVRPFRSHTTSIFLASRIRERLPIRTDATVVAQQAGATNANHLLTAPRS